MARTYGQYGNGWQGVEAPKFTDAKYAGAMGAGIAEAGKTLGDWQTQKQEQAQKAAETAADVTYKQGLLSRYKEANAIDREMLDLTKQQEQWQRREKLIAERQPLVKNIGDFAVAIDPRTGNVLSKERIQPADTEKQPKYQTVNGQLGQVVNGQWQAVPGQPEKQLSELDQMRIVTAQIQQQAAQDRQRNQNYDFLMRNVPNFRHLTPEGQQHALGMYAQGVLPQVEDKQAWYMPGNDYRITNGQQQQPAQQPAAPQMKALPAEQLQLLQELLMQAQ